jgi:hypothetical protein
VDIARAARHIPQWIVGTLEMSKELSVWIPEPSESGECVHPTIDNAKSTVWLTSADTLLEKAHE